MSFKLHTLETRWFYPGGVPSEFKFWFESLEKVEKYPPRIDLYLTGVGEDLGIKLREGRLEIKQRTAEHGQFSFAPSVAGKLEEWVKWSMEVEGSAFGELSEQENWLAVRKIRQQASFSLADHGKLVPIGAEEFPPTNGGSFELTKISVLDQLWWTVGLEVFGKPDRMKEVFDKVMQFTLDAGLGWRFNIDHSVAYPAWIEQFSIQPD